MSQSNPILALAERFLGERPTPDDLQQQVNTLVKNGVGGQEINGALQAAITPASPTQLVQIVGQICVALASAMNHGEWVGRIHLVLANSLNERYDRLSLLLAVEHFQQARYSCDPRSADHGGSQMNEGNTRCNLAELGIEALEHLKQAINLYQDARERFDPKSADYGSALMNEGTAWAGLAELGIDPQTNLTQAIDLYQQARRCFDPKSSDCGPQQDRM